MPKLHDACQILIEEILDSLADLEPGHQAACLCLALHEAETWLQARRRDGQTIAAHLWLVLEAEFGSCLTAASTSDFPAEDDARLQDCLEQTGEIAGRLFPADDPSPRS
jgi:hypothetical protein